MCFRGIKWNLSNKTPKRLFLTFLFPFSVFGHEVISCLLPHILFSHVQLFERKHVERSHQTKAKCCNTTQMTFPDLSLVVPPEGQGTPIRTRSSVSIPDPLPLKLCCVSKYPTSLEKMCCPLPLLDLPEIVVRSSSSRGKQTQRRTHRLCVGELSARPVKNMLLELMRCEKSI